MSIKTIIMAVLVVSLIGGSAVAQDCTPEETLDTLKRGQELGRSQTATDVRLSVAKVTINGETHSCMIRDVEQHRSEPTRYFVHVDCDWPE